MYLLLRLPLLLLSADPSTWTQGGRAEAGLTLSVTRHRGLEGKRSAATSILNDGQKLYVVYKRGVHGTVFSALDPANGTFGD